jgi:hypothetical protein
MTKDEMMNELGLMGEKIVINMLNEEGRKVKTSVDKYDSEKDLLIDGKFKAEVKTQVPFIMQNAFSFKPNQLKKCRGVDELYFVSVPAGRHSDKWEGWIFKADPKSFIIRDYHTKDGRHMLLIDREQEALKPIIKMSDDEMKELQKYTVSGY